MVKTVVLEFVLIKFRISNSRQHCYRHASCD
nr:MAG TPA: hypothetical protein [Bacteriophage sp.]